MNNGWVKKKHAYLKEVTNNENIEMLINLIKNKKKKIIKFAPKSRTSQRDMIENCHSIIEKEEKGRKRTR